MNPASLIMLAELLVGLLALSAGFYLLLYLTSRWYKKDDDDEDENEYRHL